MKMQNVLGRVIAGAMLAGVLTGCDYLGGDDSQDTPVANPNSGASVQTPDAPAMERVSVKPKGLVINDGATVEAMVEEGGAAPANPDTLIVTLPKGVSFGPFSGEQAVEPGDTFFGRAEMRVLGDTDTEVVMQIVRFCSATEPEYSGERYDIGSDWTEITASHTFAYAHDCAFARITTTGADAEFEVRAVSIEKLDAPGDEPDQ